MGNEEIVIIFRRIDNAFAQVKEHSKFLFPLVVTCFFGLIFVCVTYYSDTGTEKTFLSFLKLVFDFLIPTTTTYVLCEVISNLTAIKGSLSVQPFWTISTLIGLAMYEGLYTVYLLSRSGWWLLILIIATVILLIGNAFSYREGYQAQHRNHGLV